MPRRPVTDFERLFHACSSNRAFRNKLAIALAGDDDEAVIAVLRKIGVEGEGVEVRRRVKALRRAKGPIGRLGDVFEGPGVIAP